MSIPKVYYLERPANYDEVNFRTHLRAVRTLLSFRELYGRDNELFNIFFHNKDDRRVCMDLLRWVIDTNRDISEDEIGKKLVSSMFEAGFFGG